MLLTDIDECITGTANEVCFVNNASCLNLPGTFVCFCAMGFRMNANGSCIGKVPCFLNLTLM